ncbi:zinc finger protein MAGPIE-like isoform X1 [Typha angustifolia]|uniref:zinc finger protein MAGPIE-like isoform X1 n=1 Tax=Typha angustifolia TaxID=59011 RepID=UPI003C2BB413
MMTGAEEEAPNPDPDSDPSASCSKRKRNLPGNPGRSETFFLAFASESPRSITQISPRFCSDPKAEVITLSPRTLLSSSTYTCDTCGKEFRREQNLRIHRRGHSQAWSSPEKKPSSSSSSSSSAEKLKRAYVCPEEGCVHHDPNRALGDLTGIKKHYRRKHGERKWACGTCSKRYAVRTDWKAHVRICGSREYECLCGTLFSRKESYLVHRASCDAPAAAESDEGFEAVDDLRFKANTFNNDLLFPSLWGQASTQTEEDEDEQRAKEAL